MTMAITSSPIAAPNIGRLVNDPELIISFVLDNTLHVLGAIAIFIIGFWIAGRAD